MLKGEVFGRQLFENQIFALFINTFLNGNNGVCGDYLNGMAVTYSGNNVTVDTGAVCIQGRFLEEDAGTTLDAGSTALFCKLVIEIDLDKVNTDETFNQGYYKIITDSSAYPTLTQTDIVGLNSGVYQYELARFKTSTNGITDFVDTRTYLDISSIYDNVTTMIQNAIDSIEDGSAFVTKNEASYSTNETNTGQSWIDGKPIYRKVVTLSLTQPNTDVVQDVSNLNIKTVTHIEGISQSDPTSTNYTWDSTVDRFRTYYNPVTKKIYAQGGSTYPTVPCTVYVIIEYTKTTD